MRAKNWRVIPRGNYSKWLNPEKVLLGYNIPPLLWIVIERRLFKMRVFFFLYVHNFFKIIFHILLSRLGSDSDIVACNIAQDKFLELQVTGWLTDSWMGDGGCLGSSVEVECILIGESLPQCFFLLLFTINHLFVHS